MQEWLDFLATRAILHLGTNALTDTEGEPRMKDIRVSITSEPSEVGKGEPTAFDNLKKLQDVMSESLGGPLVQQWIVVDRLLRDADVKFYREHFARLVAEEPAQGEAAKGVAK